MKWVLAASVLLALSACGTPQQQCITHVSRDVNILDRLISETQANIARGFAYVETEVDVPMWVPCADAPDGTGARPHVQMCDDGRTVTVRKPVAIDLTAEAAKLASMQKRRTELVKTIAPAIAQCQAQYPE